MELCGSLSILWHCLSLGVEWKLTFSSPVATAEFSKFAGILSAALSQHHLSEFGIAQLEFSCFFYDPMDVGNLISGSSTFSKSSLNIWEFSVHVLLKPGLENFEHYFTSVWAECNCAVVWAFFGIAFLWDWNESWPFPVLWPLLSFPNLLAYWVQHFHSIIFQEFTVG